MRSQLMTLLLCLPIAACDQVQFQALRAYMAVNDNITATATPTAIVSAGQTYYASAVVEELEFPWDFVFIGPNEVLITEKPGRLQRIDLTSGERQLISGTPEVLFKGQGGLQGIELHPDFADNQLLYLSYSAEVGDKHQTTHLMRARLSGNALVDTEVLFIAQPARTGFNHWGAALEFGADDKLYMSVGDRQERKYAQQLDAHLGKILRLNDDGSAPPDNPFVGTPNALPEIYSYGHRNPQGLARHPRSGELWESEHGPQGGDEINIIRAGHNYGWPVITYGEEYGGGTIGKTEAAGMAQPIHYYVPSIATGGIGFYSGNALRAWQDNLFVTGLRATLIERLDIDADQVITKERLLEDLTQRWRAVKTGPDGLLYALAENGTLVRISASGQTTIAAIVQQ